ncbi:FAD-dependent oxidoreductase [Gulosibacter sp. ACHW.36C]|uniref:FAD-dependent oxidoreductase n=1 Tax=Gulosibacter sediminis TaxID=1729695 RepID=A0ABY4MXG8_9MICO|nr:FAD-dependent oxidoreductase [Gulosibacter sediminis]UQN15121.1 FAD-dependent oxidoreductase [Gulosibacter sediminis]
MKIAVIGVGAIGSQVLWQLSQRPGVEAHGFESGYIGHPFAGAGGEGRLYRNFELTTEAYMPIVRAASGAWAELEQASGTELIQRQGVLLIGDEGDAQLQHAARMATEWELPYEQLEGDALRTRFPQFAFRRGQIGLVDTTAGVISPEKSIMTAVAQAVQRGATVHEFAPVASIREANEGVEVTRASGEVEAFDRVVVACGGWTTKLVPELRDWIVTRRLTSAWFIGRDDGYLDGLPPFMQVAPGYCYGIPTEGGRSVKLGLGFNDHLPTGDPDTLPRHLEHDAAHEQRDKFAWVMRELLPGLAPNPVRMQTYVESYTRSMHEYLDLAPGHSNTVVLGGFSGHGFKIAPAIGQIGADLAVSGESALDLEFLKSAQPVFEITDAATGATTRNSVVESAGRGN